MSENFVFAGYLVQGPFPEDIPGREGFRVATMDNGIRSVHPEFATPAFEDVNGCVNPTILRAHKPDIGCYPGWVLSGYAIERRMCDWLMSTRIAPGNSVQTKYKRYEYARYIKRQEDGLQLLGYDVIDGQIDFLSLLNNCAYSVLDVERMAGRLNDYALLDSYDYACLFVDSARRDTDLSPHNELPVVWQVWGRR